MKNTPPAEPKYEFTAWSDVRRAYKSLCLDYTQAKSRAFYAAVKDAFPKYAAKSDTAIQKVLARETGKKTRSRKDNPLVDERKKALVTALYPAFISKRSRAYSKGAYADKTKTSRRTIIRELFTEEPTLKAQADAILADPYYASLKSIGAEAKTPADRDRIFVRYLEKLFVEVDGGANPTAEVATAQYRGRGVRAMRPGQIIYIDASTTKCEVANSFGTKSENGYQRPFFFLARDVASRKIFGYRHTAENEVYGWAGGLPSWNETTQKTAGNFFYSLLGEMGHAPEIISIDKVSGVAAQLLSLDEEKEINVMPGVLAMLACGTIFHIRKGGAKTAGNFIERDVRTVQDYIEGVEARLAISKELAGQGLRKNRKFDSELEYARAFNEAIQKTNSLLVPKPAGFEAPENWLLKMREQHWTDYLAQMPLALAPDWRSKVGDIIRKARIWKITNRRAKVGYGSDMRFADLEGAIRDMDGVLTDYSGEERTAIALPGGMIAGDKPGLVRVHIIDNLRENKLPRMLLAEAQVARVDEYCQDVKRPTPGHYCALPDRQVDEIAKVRDTANKDWKRRVKQATTDEPISEGVIL